MAERSKRGLAVIICAVVAAPAVAAAPAPTVADGWFRVAGASAAGYFTLANPASAPITLTGAHSPACGTLSLHQTTSTAMADMPGMAPMSHMAPVAKIEIAAGGSVTFAPGGYHLMCEKPTPALKPGATVPVTLSLADGGSIETGFTVKDAAGH